MGANSVKVKNLQGEQGGAYHNDTSAHSGDWVALKAVGGDAVFTAIMSNIDNLPAALTITENDYLLAHVTSFTLASGAVIAYHRDSLS